MNKKLALVLLIAVLAGAYLAEIYTQYYFAPRVQERSAEKRDNRVAIEVVRDLRKRGTVAYPYLFFRGHQMVKQKDGNRRSIFTRSGKELAPLGFISGVETVLCNESGEWLTYRADERGFNNPSGLWNRRKLDIATLGDSFTHGVCVEPSKHMIGLIRAKYPDTLNLGRLGTGPLFQLATLREYLPSFKPKVVLWFILEDNDIDGDLHDELEIPILKNYLNAEFRQNLFDEQPLIDRLLKGYVDNNIGKWVKIAERNRSTGRRGADWVEVSPRAEGQPVKKKGPTFDKDKFYNTLKLQNSRSAIRLGGVRGRKKDRLLKLYGNFEEILVEAKKTVTQWDGNLIVVYLAGNDRFVSWRQRSVREFQRKELMKIFDRHKVEVLDTIREFEKHDYSSLFQGHYTPEGYRLVADMVLKNIAPIFESAK